MPGPGKVSARSPDLEGVRSMQSTPETPAQSCRNQGLHFMKKLSLADMIYVNS